MSLYTFILRQVFVRQTNKTNANLKTPKDVVRDDDVRYGPIGGHHNRLDIYRPQKTNTPLPTIIIVHGGGYIFGHKEDYQYYGMALCRRGFTVVNFNYRLAPKHKFPAPLEDMNHVMQWILKNAANYHIDLDKLFVVGDSAGAQIASQYLTLLTNPEYNQYFSFSIPKIEIKAVALNCGMYDLKHLHKTLKIKGVLNAYLPKQKDYDNPMFDVLGHINSSFPKTFVMSASHDYLKDHAKPFYTLLKENGVEATCKIYENHDASPLKHDFQLNVKNAMAHQCNDEQTAFFLKQIKT